jgi:hypothetical protein
MTNKQQRKPSARIDELAATLPVAIHNREVIAGSRKKVLAIRRYVRTQAEPGFKSF